MNGALYVSESGNTKINGSKKVDATYASIEATCPKTCPFKGEGCYAQMGYTSITTHKLDRQVEGLSAYEVAKAEANAIDSSYGGGSVPTGRDLRIHVSGDARSSGAAKVIAKAVDRWKARGGNKVWSYTHAWHLVPRSFWGQVSVLASIEDVRDIKQVRSQGYAPAIVVNEFQSDKAFWIGDCDTKFIPCPSQTRGVGCTDCRLCFDADKLRERNAGIAFSAHGPGKNKVKKSLTVLR